MTGTGFVAAWGAIVATIALAWNIYNSLSNKPIVKVTTKSNVSYPDSRVISTKTTSNGEEKKIAAYCHIDITNTGKLPTTITDTQLTHKDNRKSQFSCTIQRFEFFQSKDLPALLGPGELLCCRVEMLELERISKYGTPELRISVSHLKKPIIVIPKLKAANN